MRLILLRHGVAVERGEWPGDDAERPLTKAGVHQATTTLKLVRPLVKAIEIWTSPWLRARATAELASAIWKLPLREAPWLAGEAATPKQVLDQLRTAPDVVLVGHEPDLGALIGHLIGAKSVAMAKAGIAVLKGSPEAGGMELKLLLSPKAVATIYDMA